jgi:hypothetical protein
MLFLGPSVEVNFPGVNRKGAKNAKERKGKPMAA